MGLGKTLQTLCALALSLDNDTNLISRCSLIICPRTLVDHWCNEWRRFFPGRAPARHVEGMPVKWKSAEIVVAAYEDLKANSSLGRIAWNYVVLDEGHVLRNPKTAIWRAANELNSTSRLILSGTPVQNSPADLWALFTWLMPGYLGDERHFRSRFLRKILKCRSHRANEKDIQDGSEAISQLHRLILPFIMRRLKSEVNFIVFCIPFRQFFTTSLSLQQVLRELPDKNVQDYECQLSEEQRTIYKFIVDRCTANRTQLAARRGISPLHALMALRQLVDHPLLIQDVLMKLAAPEEIMKLVPNASSGKIAALGQLLSECGIGVTIEEKDPEDESWCNILYLLRLSSFPYDIHFYRPTFVYTCGIAPQSSDILSVEVFCTVGIKCFNEVPNASSGKIAALGQLLSECGIGVTIEEKDPEDENPLSSIPVELPHRALIFCQWKSSVQLVSNALTRGDFGAPISHLVLDGSVPPSDRQSIVDRFNTDHLIDVLVCTANRTQLAARRGISPLHALMALRQLVDHPLLIQDVLMKLAAPEEIMKLVPNASSGKIAALGQLLSECGIGVTIEEKDPEDENPLSSIPVELPHRALIFCQWKSSVQLVSNALTRGDFGAPISHLVLDGS
ncbi:unnamed protein product, partial [Haemonchus placei]|uniref:Helicase ATP-binding domain-containing protein n=1 Tax=Haemonchus placei TaxID=6290 RepID=A0A0N4XBS0_HAEPC